MKGAGAWRSTLYSCVAGWRRHNCSTIRLPFIAQTCFHIMSDEFSANRATIFLVAIGIIIVVTLFWFAGKPSPYRSASSTSDDDALRLVQEPDPIDRIGQLAKLRVAARYPRRSITPRRTNSIDVSEAVLAGRGVRARPSADVSSR
jgi:hypothetical protein